MAIEAYGAADVAAELRRRLPGIGVKKLHKLLYYCQGHHLADLGRPLFTESIAAWDTGPVVGALWKSEQAGRPSLGRPLGQAALNTIGYVVSRYGALTGRDLEILSHGEQPWLAARARGEVAGDRSPKLSRQDLKAFFSSTEGDDEPTQAALPVHQLHQFLEGAGECMASVARADDLGQLKRCLAALREARAGAC
jgi:uncharacterized phage-associated protein